MHHLARASLVASGLVSVVLAGLGCGPAGAVAVLGEGAFSFLPIVDGAGVRINHGSQDGYHIWASVLIARADASALDVRLTLRYAATDSVINVSPNTGVAFYPMDPGKLPAGTHFGAGGDPTVEADGSLALPGAVADWRQYLGFYAYLGPNSNLPLVRNEKVKMTADIANDAGLALSLEHEFTALPPVN